MEVNLKIFGSPPLGGGRVRSLLVFNGVFTARVSLGGGDINGGSHVGSAFKGPFEMLIKLEIS